MTVGGGFEPRPQPAERRALFDVRRLISDLRARIDALGASTNSTGTFIQGGWATAPDGYLLMDGVTVVGGAVTYPNLAAMFPSWVSGSDLIPPNMANRVLLGAASGFGAAAGSMTHTLLDVNLPIHTHTINHDHAAFNTASGGGHTHGLLDSSTSAGAGAFNKTNTAVGTAFAASTGNHAHSIDVPNFTGTSGNGPGTATAVDHTPAHITVNTAVKT